MFNIIFLGTASMFPTKERNHVANLLIYEEEKILIDCGENTQRQLRLADVSPTKITRILITHLHSDHIAGLPGLLSSLVNSNYTKTLKIYGPNGIKYLINQIIKLFLRKDHNLKIEINEISSKKDFVKTSKFTISSKLLSHSVSCLGYSFKENDKRKINLNYTKKFNLTKHPLLGDLQKGKTISFEGHKISPSKATTLIPGKKITFILDTKYCQTAIDLAKDSDLLISESSFDSSLETEANAYKHLTSKQAATIAKKSNSKRLILTHFSQRYKSTKKLEAEAKGIFKNTLAAKDLLKINV